MASLAASARAQSYSPYTSDAHSILLYHFDEAAGGGVTANAVAGGKSAYTWTFTNSTGAANTTLLGATAYAGFGNCVNLGTAADVGVGYDGNGNSTYDGETTDAIAMSTLGIGGANSFTLEAIISPNAITAANREIISTDSSAGTRGFQFRMNASNQLEFNMIGVSGAQVFANIPTTGTHAIAAGNWYHVAFVYDGANCRFYWTKLDGSTSSVNQVGTTQALNLTGAGTITGPLVIGNENRAAGGEGAQSKIDEVRISSVARTPGEMVPASLGGLPYAPRGLSAIASSGTVNLSWSASGLATGYKVYRSTVSGSYGSTPLATTGTTAYVDTGVTDGTTYYYIVTAENGAGESAASSEVSAVVPAPPSTDPEVHLKFDEFSGPTAADASGNGWDGTLVNGGTWVLGKINNAVSLSGNAHVTIPSGVVSAMTDFTVAAWVKLNSVSTWARIFDFGTGTSSYMFLTPQNGGTGSVRFAILTSSGTGEQRIDGTAALATGTWTHVAVTLSGSTGTLYVDGAAVGTNAAMTYNPAALGITAQNYIGRSQFPADPYLNGLVDDFRIYNRALSPSEISDLLTITSTDDDNDGLPDSWEKLIIDADPNDGITTIQDVQPGDDFDGDGLTNLQEYQNGTDATGANDDLDNDQLSDAWEIIKFGTLNHGAYDDNDSDGYPNIAEQEGGTNPMDATSHPSWKAPRLALLSSSTVATDACLMSGGAYGRAINGISFQDQILYTFDGYQYTAYYNSVGSTEKVCLARRTVDDTSVGPWEVFETDSEFLNGDGPAWDAHNVIAFGICAQDGTLHVAFDHHNNTLRYRRSVPGLCTTNKAAWGAGMLLPEQDWLVTAGDTELDVTYPQFIATPTGGLVLDRRMGISGDGDQYFQIYDPTTGAWKPKVQFINRSGTYTGPDPFGTTRTATTRCAYINGFDFGPDGRMHVTWTWRESASQYGNRDICYAYSPDMGTSWYNNAGTKIADTSFGEKVTQDSPGITIAPLDMRQLLINQQAQCVDNDGRVHALMLHRRQDPGYEPAVFSKLFSTKFTAYYHYFRDPASGKWAQRRIPPDVYPVGSRPCIGYDAKGNVYAAYLSYPAGTDVFPGYFYGKLVIASASKASNYTDWEVQRILDVNDDAEGGFEGEPQFDQARLLSDNILAVYIQEHEPYVDSSTNGVPTPLYVYEFAVDVPEPNPVSLKFFGDDVVVSTWSNAGFSYQLQMATDLTPGGWLDKGGAVPGQDGILGLPDPGGALDLRRFYRIEIGP